MCRYLGFNRRRLRPGTPTLPAHPARRANMVNRNKCEAHFHTARLPPRQPAVYSGLLQVLTDLDAPPQHSEQTQLQEHKKPVRTAAAAVENDLGISRAHAEALAAQASLARAAAAKRIRHRPTKQLRLSRKLKNLMKKYQKQKNKKKKKKRAKQA